LWPVSFLTVTRVLDVMVTYTPYISPLSVIIQDDNEVTDVGHVAEAMIHGRSLDSIPSTYTNGSSSPGPNSM
jgi:hypothetical protein